MSFLSKLNSRLLKLTQVIPVYALIVMLVYGWIIYWFIWRFPSWSYFLSVKEILAIGAYSVVVNLFESLIVLCAPLVWTLLLPKQWFSERFMSSGGLLSLLIGGYIIYFSSVSEAADSFSYTPLIQASVFFIIAIGLSILVSRVHVVSNLISSFADRAQIFLYLSLPVSALSVFIVIVRNLIK
jgi:hypothetical protein